MIFSICANGDERALRDLLMACPDVQSQVDLVNKRDESFMVPLHHACMYGHEPVVKILLDHGADVDSRDLDCNTPLHDASREGFTTIAKCLLLHRANFTISDDMNNRAIHYAASRGHTDIIELLIKSGDNPFRRDSWGMMPISYLSPSALTKLEGNLNWSLRFPFIALIDELCTLADRESNQLIAENNRHNPLLKLHFSYVDNLKEFLTYLCFCVPGEAYETSKIRMDIEGHCSQTSGYHQSANATASSSESLGSMCNDTSLQRGLSCEEFKKGPSLNGELRSLSEGPNPYSGCEMAHDTTPHLRIGTESHKSTLEADCAVESECSSDFRNSDHDDCTDDDDDDYDYDYDDVANDSQLPAPLI